MLEVACPVHLAIIQILFNNSDPHYLYSRNVYGKEKNEGAGFFSKIPSEKEPFKNICIYNIQIIHKQ
jgi:hypothetical protein